MITLKQLLDFIAAGELTSVNALIKQDRKMIFLKDAASGVTPLSQAVIYNQPAIIDTLLTTMGIDKNVILSSQPNIFSRSIYPLYRKIGKYFFSYGGFHINTKKYQSFLHLCAQFNQIELAKIAIRCGVSMNIGIKNDTEATPFVTALSCRHYEFAKMLVMEGFVPTFNQLIETMMACNSSINLSEIITRFSQEYQFDFNKQTDTGHTPLHLAVKNDNLEVVRALCKIEKVRTDIQYNKKLGVFGTKNWGLTPYLQSLILGNLEISECIYTKRNIDDSQRNTLWGWVQKQRRLLRYKFWRKIRLQQDPAEISDIENNNAIVEMRSLLYKSLETTANNRQVLLQQYLALSFPEDMDKDFPHGFSGESLGTAAINGIINHGFSSERDNDFLHFFNNSEIQFKTANDVGMTALMLAVKAQCLPLINELLKFGPINLGIDAEDEFGRSALFYAIKQYIEKNTSIAGNILRQLLQILPDDNTCSSAPDEEGTTPLMMVIQASCQPLVAKLIKFDSVKNTIDSQDELGCSALFYAVKQCVVNDSDEAREILQLLLRILCDFNINHIMAEHEEQVLLDIETLLVLAEELNSDIIKTQDDLDRAVLALTIQLDLEQQMENYNENERRYRIKQLLSILFKNNKMSLTAKDDEGITPLMMAKEAKCILLEEALLTYESVKAENNRAWYTDDQINQLLRMSLKNKEVFCLDAMMGTDWQQEESVTNILQVNLQDFEETRLQAIAQKNPIHDRLLIPVNLRNNHWVLIYIFYPPKALPDIYYFDPINNIIPFDTEQALQQVYPGVEPVNIGQRVQEEGDDYNCGPWIIEAAIAIGNNGMVPEVGYDIENARREHQSLLDRQTNSVDFSQSQYFTSDMSDIQAQDDEINLISKTNFLDTEITNEQSLNALPLDEKKGNNQRKEILTKRSREVQDEFEPQPYPKKQKLPPSPFWNRERKENVKTQKVALQSDQGPEGPGFGNILFHATVAGLDGAAAAMNADGQYCSLFHGTQPWFSPY